MPTTSVTPSLWHWHFMDTRLIRNHQLCRTSELNGLHARAKTSCYPSARNETKFDIVVDDF